VDYSKWSNGKQFHKCEHDEFSPSDERDWLDPDSKAFQRLFNIVKDEKFTRDIRKLRMFIHTSSLEAFHSMLLKYVPKRNHFYYQYYRARVALAVMDHNFNIDREQDTEKTKVEWRKATKRWVRRRVF